MSLIETIGAQISSIESTDAFICSIVSIDAYIMLSLHQGRHVYRNVVHQRMFWLHAGGVAAELAACDPQRSPLPGRQITCQRSSQLEAVGSGAVFTLAPEFPLVAL